MNSFGLLRTNVALTTNIKLVVDSTYNLYMESIDSSPELSLGRFKKVQFNKDSYWDELVSFFYKNTPVDIAFTNKNRDDVNIMYTDFSNQYDTTYLMGAKNISNNKDYQEEYEYFAPLHISKGQVPHSFIVFRIDGAGLGDINRTNFREEILNKLKFVKIFNIKGDTNLSKFIDKNFINNPSFPINSLYIDFRNNEFSTYSGIDYDDGGYSQKSFMMDSILDNENTYLDMNKIILDGWKNNKVIYPNIINFSFLFNDTPATKTSIRKWSINRYAGFYIKDIVKYGSVTVVDLPEVDVGVSIEDNNIFSSSPFSDEWKMTPFIGIDGDFYRVEEFIEDGQLITQKNKNNNLVFEDVLLKQETKKYRVVSDKNLTGTTTFNDNLINIDENNIILKKDGTNYTIDKFNECDIWLIKIGDKYHNIIRENNSLKLNTDYGFTVTNNSFISYVNDPEPSNKDILSIIKDGTLLTFDIIKCSLCEIKDFDTDILRTDYARYEYENNDIVSDTDETKLYAKNYDSISKTDSFDEFVVDNIPTNIPVTTEYIASGDLFRIENENISDLWKKNAVALKWGYEGSISSYNYPYLLNNNFTSEDNNRTSNPFSAMPNRVDRNLDYFYTGGSILDYDFNTLNISEEFNLGEYIQNTYDYFSKYFKYNYCVSTTGDNIIPNTFLFRGIKFLVYNVDSVFVDGVIKNINKSTSNSFDTWKLSIILSNNDLQVDSTGNTFSVNNNQDWDILEEWSYDITYPIGTKVIWKDSIYVNTSESFTEDPNNTPSIMGEWVYYEENKTIFWSPLYNGNVNEEGFGQRVIYHNGEYYVFNGSGVDNFWNSSVVYNIGDIAFFKGYNWMSTKNNNRSYPNNSCWNKISTKTVWDLIELWDFNKEYKNTYVYYDDIVWWIGDETSSIGIRPSLDTKWVRFYSLIPEKGFSYDINTNNVLVMNDVLYLCNTQIFNSQPLNNGIDIYINKKFNNILINIYINDNTYTDISLERDKMYKMFYSKITSGNFIQSINDYNNSYGFVNKVRYIIMDETISVFDFDNISSVANIPYILSCQYSDRFFTRINNNEIVKYNNIPNNLSAKFTLKNGNISDIEQIDYYLEGKSYGNVVNTRKSDNILNINYHGLKNEIYNELYRYSGPYSPIFKNIKLVDYTGFKFIDDDVDFGLTGENIISKVNRNDIILKLRNNKSMYPMIDEIGYTVTKRFIFKSNWDYKYYIEVNRKQ